MAKLAVKVVVEVSAEAVVEGGPRNCQSQASRLGPGSLLWMRKQYNLFARNAALEFSTRSRKLVMDEEAM